MRQKEAKVSKQEYTRILVGVLICFMLVLGFVAAMNIKNSANLRSILANSVESQLISISLAARQIIDPHDFERYQDASASENPEYQITLTRLRSLADSVGAEYIYALKRQGDHYVFVFDTDEMDEEIFVPYELSPVHEAAFAGRRSAGVMNVDDEYGSYNTGAVPVWLNGRVVGVIGVDLADSYLESSFRTAVFNSVLLIGVLLLTMAVMMLAVIKLLRRIREMQEKLKRQALYDSTTGLPNRQYLLEHLLRLTSGGTEQSFALFFIDLDNFKTVNDKAGHDAGDEVLRQVGNYLDQALDDAKSFRPSAGKINIAARVGGDEFIQVVNGVNSADKAGQLAQQLLEGFKQAELGRFIDKYNVGLSIGVALYPYHSENYHVLIKYADIAMYHAKHGGKNQYRVYDDEMRKK